MSLISLRDRLIDEIWSGGGFPNQVVFEVETGVENILTEEGTPDNLLRVDKYLFDTRDNNGSLITNGLNYNGYVFSHVYWPEEQNGKAVIWHGGHSHTIASAANMHLVVRDLIREGYVVSWHQMPGVTANVANHNAFPESTDEINYLRVFLEGPIRFINTHIGDFDEFYMSGLSGGAWTTAMVAAIDERIKLSWHNNGVMPLAHTTPRDYEQMLPRISEWCDYQDLFVLGTSANRKQRQSCNINDNCCFNRQAYYMPGSVPYHRDVKEKASDIGGDWDMQWSKTGLHTIETPTRHAIVDFFSGQREFAITAQPEDVLILGNGTATFSVGLSFVIGEGQWQEFIDDEWIDIAEEVSTTLSIVADDKDDDGRQFRYKHDRDGIVTYSDVATLSVWTLDDANVSMRFDQTTPIYSDRKSSGTGTVAASGDRVGTWVESDDTARFYAVSDTLRGTLGVDGLFGNGTNQILDSAGNLLTYVNGVPQVTFAIKLKLTATLLSPIGFSQPASDGAGRLILRCSGTSVSVSVRRQNGASTQYSKQVNALPDRSGQSSVIVVSVDYAGDRVRVWRDGVLLISEPHGLGAANSESGSSARVTLMAANNAAAYYTGAIHSLIFCGSMESSDIEKFSQWAASQM